MIPQFNENGPVEGALTTKRTVHWLETPFGSVTVTVIGYEPGPTIPPAAGFWLAGLLSLIVAAGILFAYFLHVSRKYLSEPSVAPAAARESA